MVFVKHILDEIEYIQSTTKDLSFDSLLTDRTLKNALIRSLEVIGEASKNVSEKTKTIHPNIPWKETAGLRDKLIHFYFGVDWNIIWDVIKNKLPSLQKELNQLL